jgi:hypothetical protein
MAQAISAAAAEKPKRGRPRRWSPDDEALAKLASPDSRSARHLRDVPYCQRAIITLWDDPGRFGWLVDREKCERGISPGDCWRPSLLAELGRIDDPEAMMAVAERICEIKPATKEGVRIIRRVRLGRAPAASEKQLATALLRTVNNYLTSRPGLTLETVLEAFDVARLVIRSEWQPHPETKAKRKRRDGRPPA